jgi:hypothetical protein
MEPVYTKKTNDGMAVKREIPDLGSPRTKAASAKAILTNEARMRAPYALTTNAIPNQSF